MKGTDLDLRSLLRLLQLKLVAKKMLERERAEQVLQV